MPANPAFRNRLSSYLPLLREETPCYVYDESGIRETAERLLDAFSRCPRGFREFFAVKACPNIRIMKILREYGFGFDCASEAELVLTDRAGVTTGDVMFTSNNTSLHEYLAASVYGAILNLDDISFIKKVPDPFPKLICFRYNPGNRRTGNSIIGKPEDAKYGITHEQLIPAYSEAIDRGACAFGLHTMVASNELNPEYFVDTVRMLLDVAKVLLQNLNIKLTFINMGGGLGIPYKPEQHALPIRWIGDQCQSLLVSFERTNGYCPPLCMESGRYVTGPHGVLVTQCLNRMSKYKEYVGVDACMSSLMRPGMYGAYHHITPYDAGGNPLVRSEEVVDVVGSLCENNDKFAIARSLPWIKEGDYLVIEDAGAHGYAMGFNYNGRLRPAEWLLCSDGSLELIRRAQTLKDYLATEEFTPRMMQAGHAGVLK